MQIAWAEEGRPLRAEGEDTALDEADPRGGHRPAAPESRTLPQGVAPGTNNLRGRLTGGKAVPRRRGEGSSQSPRGRLSGQVPEREALGQLEREALGDTR